MSITAESVVVEVIAKLDKAKGDIKNLDATFTTSTDSMQRSARTLEGAIVRLDKSSVSSFSRVGDSAKKAANDIEGSVGRTANATRNLGRQVADVGTQLAGGQSPFLIFAQQAPQVADALADTGGKAAQVAAFFAGPWGAALLAAGSILGLLIPKLLEASDASNTMTKAQVDLYTFVDRTTGAINKQTTAIQRLAAAQARQDDIESNTRAHGVARGSAIGAVRQAAGVADPIYTAGGVTLPAAITDPIKQRLRDLAAEAIKTKQPINDFALAVRAAVGDRPEYRELVKTVTSQAAAAVNAAQGVQKLRAEQALLTGTATAQQKAILGLGQTTAGLIEKQVALATATTTLEKARARLSLVEDQGRNVAAGDAKGLAQYRADLTGATNAVHAAEAAEKAASAAKRDHAKASREAAKEVREQAKAAREHAKAERELLSLQSESLGARSDLTSDSRQQDEFSRQRIQLDRQGRLGDAQERADRHELTAGEFDERKKLINEIADSRLDLVNRNESVRFANEELASAQAGIGHQRDILEAQEGLANTTKERKAIELKLLDLAIEEQRLAAQKVVDLATQGKASEQEGRLAQGTLDALPRVRDLGAQRVEQDNAGPLDQYKRQLQGTADDMNAALDAVKVNGLQSLEDGLTGVLSGTKSVGDAFSDMASRIIQDIERIAIEQLIILPLLKALGGGAGGLDGGGLGSLIGELFGLKDGGPAPGFAGGGRISGPGTGRSDSILALGSGGAIRVSNGEFIVNEQATQRFLPVLEAMNAGRMKGYANGGRVAAVPELNMGPLSSIAVSAPRSVTIVHAPQYHLKSPVVTSDLLTEFDRRNAASLAAAAPHIAQAGANQAIKQMGDIRKFGQPGASLVQRR